MTLKNPQPFRGTCVAGMCLDMRAGMCVGICLDIRTCPASEQDDNDHDDSEQEYDYHRNEQHRRGVCLRACTDMRTGMCTRSHLHTNTRMYPIKIAQRLPHGVTCTHTC